MVQSALIFALGFLAAVLLSLMVAPTIWRRAVFLTRKRIEAALPLTANELNAEKDKLRAEHALAVRRVEMQVRELREQGAEQKIFIEEQADNLRAAEKKLGEAVAKYNDIADDYERLTVLYNEQRAALSHRPGVLESAWARLGMRGGELNAANRQVETDKADIANQEAHIETINATVAELQEARRELQRQVGDMNAEGRATGNMLTAERKRMSQLEAKLEQSVAKIVALERELERRERETGRKTGESDVDAAELAAMETRALAAEKIQKALEQEIAEMTIRIDRLMSAAFDGKGHDAMVEELQVRMAQQSVEMHSLLAERDMLKRELALAKSADNVAGDSVLREKLNQLAAEVVAMAARLEGPQSRINTLMADDTMPAAGDVISLAERIKALQRSSGAKRSSA